MGKFCWHDRNPPPSGSWSRGGWAVGYRNMGIKHWAQQFKHHAFIGSKRARWAGRDLRLRVDDRRWAWAERRHPFEYTPSYYAHTFLARRSPEVGPIEDAPAILWAFWLGGEPSPARRRSLAAFQDQRGLEVRVVRSADEVLMPTHPLHKAFDDLHVVHRSDYLRAYVMHHYGGIYTDVKPLPRQMLPSLDLLNRDVDAWVVGYREITSNYVPDLPHVLGSHIRRHYRAVMGPSAFICRPHSVFTAEWLRELHARLDYYSGSLADAEASGCNPYEAPADYPIRWSEILGDITQPLTMKHQTHIRFSDDVRPVLKGYR